MLCNAQLDERKSDFVRFNARREKKREQAEKVEGK